MNLLKQSTCYQSANYRALLYVARLRFRDKLYKIAVLRKHIQFSQKILDIPRTLAHVITVIQTCGVLALAKNPCWKQSTAIQLWAERTSG